MIAAIYARKSTEQNRAWPSANVTGAAGSSSIAG